MQAELEFRARWGFLIAEQDTQLASGGFEEPPSIEEYRMLEKVYGTPLYRDHIEAEAALSAGGPGLLEADDE